VSPHMYPHGTPSEVLATRPSEDVEDDAHRPTEDVTAASSSSSPPLVGILLIDHGSKRDSSNQRLHDMASWYQECVQSVAVEPAHMEIASPSIKEGMAKLLERGADEIVCHPFFLGPGGT
jgi:CbiX